MRKLASCLVSRQLEFSKPDDECPTNLRKGELVVNYLQEFCKFVGKGQQLTVNHDATYRWQGQHACDVDVQLSAVVTAVVFLFLVKR